MKTFRADLHIHTLLSPCGDLEMSPAGIIAKARSMGLDIIGITDHNSTLQCGLVRKHGADSGVRVLTGAEVTTREEVHCLVFFETEDLLTGFQSFLDSRLPNIMNDPARFGYQVVVDENEQIIKEEKRMLTNALECGIEELERVVHGLNGLFIPAHIDKPRFSIIGQLGFLPADLIADALEISPFASAEVLKKSIPGLNSYSLVSGSDAHYLHQVGTRLTLFESESPDFGEIRMALQKKGGRKTKVLNYIVNLIT